MEHPPPSPTALHTGCTTRYPISLYGTPPPPSPTTLHTGCTTRYPISLYGTPLPPPPQHCTPGVLHGTPSAFMEHPPLSPTTLHTRCTTRYPTSLFGTPPPLPHSTAHRVYYMVPHQPLWNTPLPPPPQHCTPGVLHGTPLAPIEHHTPSPTALHTRCTAQYPTSFYGIHPCPLLNSTAHQVLRSTIGSGKTLTSPWQSSRPLRGEPGRGLQSTYPPLKRDALCRDIVSRLLRPHSPMRPMGCSGARQRGAPLAPSSW